MKTLPLTVLLVTLLSVTEGVAAVKTVTLAVENMNCPTCPFIVEQSLLDVSGVTEVVVSVEDETATVTYDDGATSIQALITATTNAGYPSRPAE